MKRLFWFCLFILLLIEVYSLMPKRYPSVPKHLDSNPSYAIGIIHVASRYSLGTGAVPEIAEAAQRSGIDFLVLTDQNTAQGRRDGFERRYEDTDVYIEMEAVTPGGHSLIFYSHTPAVNFRDQIVRELAWKHFQGHESVPGVFTVIAHPSNLKTPWNSLDKFPDGVEVINFDSQWRRQFDESAIGFGITLLSYPFNNYLAGMRFSEVFKKDLLSWDAMNAASPGRFGILAHNTEANWKIAPGQSAAWPGYEQSFRFGSNVVFIDPPLNSDFNERKKQIYQSLEQGRLAMLFQYLHPFDGNDFFLRCPDRSFRSGEVANYPNMPRCEFVAKVPPSFPYPTKLSFFKNGDLVKTISGRNAEVVFPSQGPGTYRLEVWAEPRSLFHVLVGDSVPYVFYNPVYIR